MTMLSRAEEIILLAVYKLAGGAYGVTIREQIREDIGRAWAFGVVYKTLNKMTRKGYVRKIPGDSLSERGGRSRFYYEITPSGLQALHEIRRVQASVWKGAEELPSKSKAG